MFFTAICPVGCGPGGVCEFVKTDKDEDLQWACVCYPGYSGADCNTGKLFTFPVYIFVYPLFYIKGVWVEKTSQNVIWQELWENNRHSV